MLQTTTTKRPPSLADKIFFRVSAYESFKSKLTSNSPVNPLSVRGRLRECKTPEFVWEVKRGFVMVVVSRTIRCLVNSASGLL